MTAQQSDPFDRQEKNSRHSKKVVEENNLSHKVKSRIKPDPEDDYADRAEWNSRLGK